LAFCFFASSICITVLLSGFLAILADPAVRVLEKLWIPRFIAAGSIVLTGVLICGFLIYVSHDKLADFSDEFPSYISRIGDAVSPISRKIERVQDSAGKLQHEASPKKVPEVRVQQNGSWAAYLVRGVGSVWGVAIIAGVVPFLMFFMLLAREKIFFCLKTMFGHRVDVDQFADRLTGMVRCGGQSGDRGYLVRDQHTGVLARRVDASSDARADQRSAKPDTISGNYVSAGDPSDCWGFSVPQRRPVHRDWCDGGSAASDCSESVDSAFCRLAAGRRTRRRYDWSSFLGLAVGSARTSARRAVNWIRETDGGRKSIFGALVESFGT
jgi:AI-2E family transporter